MIVLEQIKEMLADFFYVDPDEIEEDTNLFYEYSLTDEDVCDILDEINNMFDIEITKKKFESFDTIKDLVEYIEENI